LNGAVAHLGKIGDRLTIMAFAEVDEARAARWEPRLLTLDSQNRIQSRKGDSTTHPA
jgi:aspartate 1-decarboxylase